MKRFLIICSIIFYLTEASITPAQGGIFGGGFSGKVRSLLSKVDKSQKIAVSYIYRADSGNVTALGNLWRDRVEEALSKAGWLLVPRMDMGILVEDVESHGLGEKEKELWEKTGADVIVCGRYYIHPGKEKTSIELYLKAIQVFSGAIVGTVCYRAPLAPGWIRLEAQIKGNVYQQKLRLVSSSTSPGPKLFAHLDRSPACYPPGAAARITVKTEKGAHIYILDIQADNTVTLLYPNRFMPDRPLVTGRLIFPPPGMDKNLKLRLFPMEPGKPCQEAIKVIASYKPMDFSWIPVPENSIFTGIRGGNIKRLYKQLQESKGWSEVVLDYWVSSQCQAF